MAPQDYPNLHGFGVVIALLHSVYVTLVVATVEDVVDAVLHIKEALAFLLEALIPVAVHASRRNNKFNQQQHTSAGTQDNKGIATAPRLASTTVSSTTNTTQGTPLASAGQWNGFGDESEGSCSDSCSDGSSSESTKSLQNQFRAGSETGSMSSSNPITPRNPIGGGVSSWVAVMGPDGRPVGGGNLSILRRSRYHQAHMKNWLRNATRHPNEAAATHAFLEYIRRTLHGETHMLLEQLFGIPNTQPLPVWPTSRHLKRIIRNNGVIRPKVLVLDLDETLLCAVVDKQSHSRMYKKPTYHEAIPTATGATMYAVWERPHVRLFLSVMSRMYSLVLFTASLSSYADPLVDRLEGSHPLSNNGGGGRPSVAIFRKRLYREHCTRCTVSGGGTPTSSFASLPTNNNGGVPVPPVLGCEPPPAIKAKKAYVKDLTKLDVPLQDVIILDNKAESFALQPENGLVIKNFDLTSLGGNVPEDSQLLALIPVLTALAFVPDVRQVLRMQLPTAHQQQ